MQPLGTKNITQPIETKKITQPLTTKNTQTLGTKKCPTNSNLSHKQTPGDRHRSPWSCLLYKLQRLYICLLSVPSVVNRNLESWRLLVKEHMAEHEKLRTTFSFERFPPSTCFVKIELESTD